MREIHDPIRNEQTDIGALNQFDRINQVSDQVGREYISIRLLIFDRPVIFLSVIEKWVWTIGICSIIARYLQSMSVHEDKSVEKMES